MNVESYPGTAFQQRVHFSREAVPVCVGGQVSCHVCVGIASGAHKASLTQAYQLLLVSLHLNSFSVEERGKELVFLTPILSQCVKGSAALDPFCSASAALRRCCFPPFQETTDFDGETPCLRSHTASWRLSQSPALPKGHEDPASRGRSLCEVTENSFRVSSSVFPRLHPHLQGALR